MRLSTNFINAVACVNLFLDIAPSKIIQGLAILGRSLIQNYKRSRRKEDNRIVMNGRGVIEGLVWSGLVWSGLVWSGLVWSGQVWSGLVSSGLVMLD